MNFFKKSKIVYNVPIHGKIDQKMVESLAAIIKQKKKDFKNAQFLAVSINSQGGTNVYCKQIVQILKELSQNLKIPYYTFAEEQVLGGGNIILTSGDKVFADSYSFIGDYGHVLSGRSVKKLIENYGVNFKFIHSGQNKIRLNPLNDVKQEDIEWYKKLFAELDESLQNEIKKNRENKFSSELDFNKIGILSSESALKFGLIDDIKNLDELIQQEYSSSRVEVLEGKKSPFQQFSGEINFISESLKYQGPQF